MVVEDRIYIGMNPVVPPMIQHLKQIRFLKDKDWKSVRWEDGVSRDLSAKTKKRQLIFGQRNGLFICWWY